MESYEYGNQSDAVKLERLEHALQDKYFEQRVTISGNTLRFLLECAGLWIRRDGE